MSEFGKKLIACENILEKENQKCEPMHKIVVLKFRLRKMFQSCRSYYQGQHQEFCPQESAWSSVFLHRVKAWENKSVLPAAGQFKLSWHILSADWVSMSKTSSGSAESQVDGEPIAQIRSWTWSNQRLMLIPASAYQRHLPFHSHVCFRKKGFWLDSVCNGKDNMCQNQKWHEIFPCIKVAKHTSTYGAETNEEQRLPSNFVKLLAAGMVLWQREGGDAFRHVCHKGKDEHTTKTAVTSRKLPFETVWWWLLNSNQKKNLQKIFFPSVSKALSAMLRFSLCKDLGFPDPDSAEEKNMIYSD